MTHGKSKTAVFSYKVIFTPENGDLSPKKACL
jgi:hypothetical protein